MSTINDLIQHISPENILVMSYDFETVYRGPVANMPNDLRSEKFYEAYHDTFNDADRLEVRTIHYFK